MKITVIGIGYVGLANAILFAQNNEVIAYDISEERVNMINKRIPPFHDLEIEDFLENKEINLEATCDRDVAYREPDIIIIAVPTNYDPSIEYFDTTVIEKVIADIESYRINCIIVIKSTVPIGFTAKMRFIHPNLSIIFSPEFLREGKALYDSLYPTRIIIGDETEKGRKIGGLIMQNIAKKDAPMLFMPSTEAETIKLFSNAFLALRISFINEIDTFAEINSLDSKAIINGICLDTRIGAYYNNPSFGYGGYCLPKDVMQLRANYRNIQEKLITAIIKSNEIRKKHISDMILKREPNIVGVYQLTMKADSDNTRSSAVFDIIDYLKNSKIAVIIFEPLINEKAYYNCQVVNNFDEFCKLSDLIIANRLDDRIRSIKEKIYTRDIYCTD